ncbi:Multifunctional methyltransferase subunit trm112 [Lecanosticta acicola]|uniref:Multifunctional methyltransferase subunit trm112 n=1 Tax=Lecanosticta acicola TaxID=111012 RepID=A0AAI9EFH1_9PEZI|nr:Multifunctional methyltransferase subunit trm112 [Lecanosticta acicola]
MKLLTLNFLTCARKACKSSPDAFPLHPKEAELEQVETDCNPLLIKNLLPRLDWNALKILTNELGLPNLPEQIPNSSELFSSTSSEGEGDEEAAAEEPTQTLTDLHTLLMETCIASGKLACGHCGHEYAVKEGIANFLLPSHLV